MALDHGQSAEQVLSMTVGPRPFPGRAPWRVDDIPYDSIAVDRIRGDLDLFYLVASASFVEITSDLYTRNLLDYFSDDPTITAWLQQEWEPEELQHGAALRRYVETIWPDFDWMAAYENFYRDYTADQTAASFPARRSLELAGRCVVETGTAAFYRMLADSSPEPILMQIADKIARDEVRHYKNFYYYFKQYAAIDQPGKPAILGALWAKSSDIKSRNTYYAFKHTYTGANHDRRAFCEADYSAFRAAVRRRAQSHFPRDMAVRMLLKPLGLGKRTGRVLLPLADFTARYVLGH